MTRIDKYLEKYLDGSISEQETEEFRALLASDPRLGQELSETLELRSVIHDDLLEIEPPSHLSTRVAEMVGERFAMLAFEDEVQEEEEEEKRRGVILPWFISGRMAGSMAVAAVALLMVALAPTVDFRTGVPGGFMAADYNGRGVDQERPIASLVPTPSAPQQSRITVEQEITSSSTPENTAESQGVRQNSLSQAGTSRSVPVNSGGESVVAVSDEGEESSFEIGEADDPADAASRNGTALGEEYLAEETHEVAPEDLRVAQNSINRLQLMVSTPSRFDILTQNGPIFGGRDGGVLGGLEADSDVLPTVDEILGGSSSSPRGLSLSLGGSSSSSDASLAAIPSNVPGEENEADYQRVMFGGTLASGLTNRSSSLSLEGSAFLALGLGENSRIGLEGGSATFRHRRNVTVEILTPSAGVAARGVVNDDGDHDVALISAGGRGTAAGGSGENGGARDPIGQPIDGNGDELDPSWPRDDEKLPTRGRVEPGYDVSYGLETYETDASMVYGLVFYDQTVTSLSDRLNLNGRIGIGGADGGMVLSARAYAAIATHENIAWTLGVGGSMLHDFAGDLDFNATYGLNAGVEFGF